MLLAACGGPVPDTVRPTVSLGLSASTVQAPATVTLTATATDNVGVTSVQFYRGETLLGSGTRDGNTYTRTVNLTAADAGQHVFRVVATDAAGNRAEASATLTVTVPANTTVVSGVVVNSDGSVWNGGSGTVFAATDIAGGAELGQGTLTATGAFSLTLRQPTAAELMAFPEGLFNPQFLVVPGGPFVALNCQPTTVNTSNLPRVVFPVFGLQAGEVSGTMEPASFDDASATVVGGGYVYVDREATISGQTNCVAQAEGATLPVVFTQNLVLRQGWNSVRSSVTINPMTGAVNIMNTVGELPGQWLFFPNGGEAVPLSILNKRF